MPKPILDDVLKYLHRVAAVQHARDLTDAELLRRFVKLREDAAFTVLVQRHGPMVLSVCHNVVGDGHAAEDVFQATFLVLVRWAASIRLNGSLGAWLYAVAQRIALRARSQTSARLQREKRFDPLPPVDPVDDLMGRELRSVLDEEIARLPEKYRGPIVLCYFEGKSHDQAARELGWPKKSLTNRLGCARELLRQRLVKRGITLSAGALATALCKKASAAPVAAMLVINTVKAARSFSAGNAVVGGCLSPQAVVFAEAALRGVIGLKLKLMVIALTLTVAVGGAGIAGYGFPPSHDAALSVTPNAPQQADSKRPAVVAEELPEGALRKLIWPAFRHTDMVSCIAVTRDNKQIVTGSRDGAFLWDLATGKLLKSFPGDSPYRFALSPSEDLLAIADESQVVVKEFATGKQRFAVKTKFVRPPVSPHALAFSPDGKTLALAMDKFKTIRFWETATGKEAGALAGQQAEVSGVVYHPDGKTLFSASEDGRLRQWDLATGQPTREFVSGQPWKTHTLAISADGKTLALIVHGLDPKNQPSGVSVRLLDVATFKERFSAAVPNAAQGFEVTLSENGRYVAATFSAWGDSRPWRMRLWDSWMCKDIAVIPENNSLPLAVRFLEDSKTLVTGGTDGVVRLWNVSDGQEKPLTKGPAGAVEMVCFSPSGKIMASRSAGLQVHLWDTATGSLLHTLPNETWMTNAQFSPDGSQILCSSWWRGRGSVANLWNVATGKKVRSFPQEGGCAALAPDGKTVAAADYESSLRLWDVATGAELGRLAGHAGKVHAMAFSPDGTVLASASHTMAFAPDGTALATPSEDNSLRLWSIARRTAIVNIPFANVDSGTQIWFSPDSSLLFVWDRSDVMRHNSDAAHHVINVFETTSGAPVCDIKTTHSEISGIRFIHGGATMAFAAPHGKFGTIDLVTGTILDSDIKHGGDFKNAALSPDGNLLALGYADGRLLLWPPPPLPSHESLPAAMSDSQLRQMWQALAGLDAKAALQARWHLSAAAKQTLALLRNELHPVKAADAKQIAAWIEQLDSTSFKERELAMLNLENRNNAAELALRQVLQNTPTLEVKRRVEMVLSKRNAAPTGELLRALRAVVILDNLGDGEARAMLSDFATGTPGAPLTEAAKGVLNRTK